MRQLGGKTVSMEGTCLDSSKELFEVYVRQIKCQVSDKGGVGGFRGEGEILSVHKRTAIG